MGLSFVTGEQQRRRSACACAQSDQHLWFLLSSKCNSLACMLHAKFQYSSKFVNNKGADQPAHPRSLISAFVIHSLECTTAWLVTCKVSVC